MDKLQSIQKSLQLKHGTFDEELPEQLMISKYLNENATVLELGSNIGRSSLIIAKILNDETRLVTLESNANFIPKLTDNRNINNFNFNIENCALSKRRLVQKEWNTKPLDNLERGDKKYKEISTITLEELMIKYNITFDTLVLDCEGAFYYILIDMPEILENINMVIMENDYASLEHKYYIDKQLVNRGFQRVYNDKLLGDKKIIKSFPKYIVDNFYEVWKKV
tara:strand:+ start:69 stop:737 length:669 start_codon:yes stop_codon:yes gene_type:complete